ncbi:DsrE family protein [Nitratireductor soli]|uniref:DsrE family protein n=1 Tax=Nitratireductor soli TaxID=1670619 RepID=UPI00065E3B49|nr:DsrE family protein [Nitratireductor soli]
MLKRFALACAAAIFAVLSVAHAEENDRYGPQKVVYHINQDGGEGSKYYKGALRNIQNQINAVGRDKIEVKVVMHGNGINLLKAATTDQTLQSEVTSLKTQNVAFLVCDNTLQGREMNYETDLFEVFEDEIVPSGVAEISYLQQQGYTYMKP